MNRTIQDIVPQKVNANRHTPRGMGELERSIGERGWIGAITAAADGEVFDGSARREVLETAGLADPIFVETDGSRPVVLVRTDIPTADDPRAKQLAVEANLIAAHNYAADAEVLAQLRTEIDLDSLIRPEEWDAILAALPSPDAGGAGDEFDATPAEGPTRTQLGDLWCLGPHRLLVGDCTDPANVERLFSAGEKPSAIITEPPYGIDASSMTMGKGQSDKPKYARLSNGHTWDGERPDIRFLLTMARWVCIWGGNYFADVLPITNDWLCWWKKNDERSFSEFELAWTNFGCNARHFVHHWGGEEKEHITQKPVAVMAFCIEQCPDARIVFDPFLGSGTALIAAHQTGRRCYGMEIEPRYADVILRRAEAAGLPCARRDD